MSSVHLIDYPYKAFSAQISKYCPEPVILLLAKCLSVYYIFGENGLWERHKKARRQERLVNQFAGLRNYPFLGSLPEMYHLALSPCKDFLPWTRDMRKRFGPIFRFWAIGQPKIFITCTEPGVKLLQNDSFQGKSSEISKVAQVAYGEGLTALPPDVHGPRKKMWLQWLTRKQIDKSLGRFRHEAKQLCKELEQFQMSGEKFDIVSHSTRCTFRTVAYSAFGKDYMEKHLNKNSIKKFTEYLYTIIPFSFRRSTHDVIMPDEKIIPEDVDVYVALDQIHRDPKYFPEPEKFIPSRHEVLTSAFMPFALGSRNCIEQVYAMQEMKMILAHLLMTYKWETTELPGNKPLMMGVTVPENGLYFKIERRSPN